MPRRKPASVFCLETPWDDDLRHQATVRPMLEMLQLRCGMEFIHRDAATEAEVLYYLKKWGQRRYDQYRLGILAFHGVEDGLVVGRDVIGLEALQEHLAGRLVGRTVHFSSCSTLRIDHDLIQEFLEITGARAVCGYTKAIDWMDSAVFDLALIDALTWYERPSFAFKYLERNHEGAFKRLGFRAVWNGGSLG